MRDLPECCYADQYDPTEIHLYAAYNRAGDPEKAGLNYQGLPCPTWDALPENIKEKWRAVAAVSKTIDR